MRVPDAARPLAFVFACAGIATAGAAQAAGSPPCDLSFVVNQPTYQLVSPSNGASGASIGAGRLTVATDARDLSGITEITLAPLSGKPLVIRKPHFSAAPAAAGFPAMVGDRPATIGSAGIPRLAGSTTYAIVIRAKTVRAPQSCPAALTEAIGRFTTEPPEAIDALGDLSAASRPPTGKAARLSADTVYLKALTVLRSLNYPHFITFVVTTRSMVGDKPFVESFQSLVRTDTDVVATHSIPFASTNVPENPYGFNIPILTALLRRGPHENFDEPFGTPEISPLFSFGLRRLAAPDADNPEALAPPGSDVRTLGRIVSVAHFYDVSMVGIEPYRSRYVYHLQLAPVTDPNVYRVRDLWIDTQAFIIWKLRSAGIFDSGQAPSASWNAAYSIINGHWFMASESTTESFHSGNFWHGNETLYHEVSYTLSDFNYPGQLPDFSFFTGSGQTSATQF